MQEQSILGIAIKYESKTIFRGTRPVADILQDFEGKDIPYVAISPDQMKYGSWELIIAFQRVENKEKFLAEQGQLSQEWLGISQVQAQKVNPLKASKRAAAKKK